MTAGPPSDAAGKRASIEFVWGATLRFHEQQLRDYDATDSKAGVLLGFSATLVALGASIDSDPARIIGCALAVVASIFAALAFRPSALDTLKPGHMRDHYLNMSPQDTMLRSIDSLLEHIDTNEGVQKGKVQWMKMSVWTLVLAATILGAGAIVGPNDDDQGGARSVRTGQLGAE